MNYHRWSSLLRGYDLALATNRALLVVTAAGMLLGFLLAGGDWRARAIHGLVAGAILFGAAALAKEVAPDEPRAAVPAAAAVLPFVTFLPDLSPIFLFWLLGSVRFVNRSTGLPPKWSDTIILLAASLVIAWLVSPLFAILMGILYLLDGLLPDGRRAHVALGTVVVVAAVIWHLSGDWVPTPPPLWLGAALLSITIGFMPVILGSYQVAAAGDATGQPLRPVRVQAGQSFALSAGLFLASWLGQPGVALSIGLWAALFAVLMYHWVVVRFRRSVPSL